MTFTVLLNDSLLSIKIRVHMIDNSNNEIKGSGVKRDVGGDEKHLIKVCLALVVQHLLL